jgi:hypothetical protein
MKFEKKNFTFGLIIGGIIMSFVGVYAAVTILASNISYSNSKTSAANVEDALNELYDKVPSSTYKDPILNGADPVLSDDLLPVIIDSNGSVTYVNKNGTWYNYENKMWANAIKLIGSPSKTYKEGDIISESDISAYFVWIPRYKYELWNVGVSDVTSSQVPKTIPITFESKSATKSTGSTDGTYLTHPAFTFGSTELNGIWVSKFEVTGSTSAITSKPNVNSLRSTTVGSFWNALKSYDTSDTSHMMKNTEWGAVAYLSASIYGKNSEILKNNNSSYLTGCGGVSSSTSGSSSCLNQFGTVVAYPQSTTGNISGIFDMSGGTWEYMAACASGYIGSSGLTLDTINSNSAYFDLYNIASSSTSYNNRILGDATGELGPFVSNKSSWYQGFADFTNSSVPWFARGANYGDTAGVGAFSFSITAGGAIAYLSSRMALAPEV